jgi:hypothetical protein
LGRVFGSSIPISDRMLEYTMLVVDGEG